MLTLAESTVTHIYICITTSSGSNRWQQKCLHYIIATSA